MAKNLFRMTPDVCSYMSENNNRLNIEVSMPGIDKTDIQLQAVLGERFLPLGEMLNWQVGSKVMFPKL